MRVRTTEGNRTQYLMVESMCVHEVVAPRAALRHILEEFSCSLTVPHDSYTACVHHPQVVER